MRQDSLTRLQSGDGFDLLVIGGGATGCGIALDAASRGLSVALVERGDFAEGTSSRSTKLVHGGVRYLEAAVRRLDRAQYKLVREALHERGALLKNAPHLTRRLPLVTPVRSWWQLPYIAFGLKLYDWLSGRMSLGPSRIMGRAEALRLFPHLRGEALKAAVLYYDGQFIDSRLAATLAMTARRAGAVLANHVEVLALRHDAQGRLAGAELGDTLSGVRFAVTARVVINATGPYADAIRRMDDATAPPLLKVSSGSHLMLNVPLTPPATGFLVPRTDDGRVLFVLPWQGGTLVGTTDTPAQVEAHPAPSEQDIAYLLSYVRRYFDMPVSRDNVTAAWCGIRPLVFDPKAGTTAQLARDHVIQVSASGLVSISGGKWTTYRRMSEEAVDRALAVGGLGAGPCRTHALRLLGGESFDPEGHRALMPALPEDAARHLNESYGDQCALLAPLLRQGATARLHPDHPYVEAEVLHAVRHEMAVTVADVLLRRLTLALVDRAAARAAAPRVAALMAAELGWSDATRATRLEEALERLDRGI